MKLEKNAPRRRYLGYLILISLVAVAIALFAVNPARSPRDVSGNDDPENENVVCRYGEMPGEFEKHDAVLICWPEGRNQPQQARLVAAAIATNLQIIRLAQERMKIIILTKERGEKERVLAVIRKQGLNEKAIDVLCVPFGSYWIRDFGPITMRHSSLTWISPDFPVDADDRRLDQATAGALADRYQLRRIQPRLLLEGGNLLSNGNGLVVTTQKTMELNARKYGYSTSQVKRILCEYYGATQIVVLDYLRNESTGHADMFMTFTAKDTAVVGEYGDDQDPVNRNILENNSATLRKITVDGKPLNVVRIPMPSHRTTKFGASYFGGSYTNVVFANGVLMVPAFSYSDPAGCEQAMTTYRRLLPGWKIVAIDSTAWMTLFGSLHCLTKNIYRLPKTDQEIMTAGQ